MPQHDTRLHSRPTAFSSSPPAGDVLGGEGFTTRFARTALERAAHELTENIPVGTYTMVQPLEAFAAGQVRWITAQSTHRSLPDGSTVWEGVHLVHHAVTLHEAGFARTVEIHGDGVQIQTAVVNLIRKPPKP